MFIETYEKVENFIDKLNLPVEISKVLFEKYEDCVIFFNKFYIRNKYVLDDLLDFREYKIETTKKTLDEFLKDCIISGLKPTFEATFFQHFTDYDIHVIEDAILDNKITLENIFTNFNKNHNKNILKYII